MRNLRDSITGTLLLNAVAALASTSVTTNYDSVPNTHNDPQPAQPVFASSDQRNRGDIKQEPMAVIDKKRRRKLKKQAQKRNR